LSRDLLLAPFSYRLDQPALNRNRLKAEKLIDPKVLEQLIRVQADAGCVSKGAAAAVPLPLPATKAQNSITHRPRVRHEWVVLVEPGFGQNLLAGLEVQAHLDGLMSNDDEIEMRTPVTRYVVGHGLGQD